MGKEKQMSEQRPNYNDKPVLTEEQEKEWKLKLADAILAESEIEVGDEIDHQTGIVWVGKHSLCATKDENDDEQGDTKTPL
jgi:hypothetical protein